MDDRREDPDAGNTDAGARRASGRDSLFLQATLLRIGDDAPLTVRVRNLSPGGMMAEIGTPFEPGDRIAIDLRGLGALEGTVRWRELGRVGIEFDQPIDPRRARNTVGRRAEPVSPPPQPAPRAKRPKLFE